MNEAQLPDSDPDLELARTLGRRLEDEEEVKSSDPLATLLESFRQEIAGERAASPPDRAMSASIWQGIAARISTAPSIADRAPRSRRHHGTTLRRFSVVAAALCMAAIAWWLFLEREQPQELLTASDTIPVTFTTSEGSSITLRPHSSLYLVAAAEMQERYRIEGEAYFDVVHDAGRTFIVDSGDAEISVHGTQFVVRNWSGSVEVFLREGSIALRRKSDGNALAMKPGDVGRVNRQGAEVESNSGMEAEELDWINNELNFDQHPLQRVIDELNFHFGIVIDYPPEQLAETISGTIILDNLRNALDQLGLITNGQLVQISTKRYRFEPR